MSSLYLSPFQTKVVTGMRKEMVFCGAGSFKDVDKDDEGEKPKAKARYGKQPKGKGGNPYASRGLDKFSTVVSELESRRERILRRVVGPDVDADHLMVRFVQAEGKGWVPIVVKLPAEEDEAAKKRQSNKSAKSTSRSTTPTEPASPKEDAGNKHVAPAVPAARKKKAGVVGERWSWSWGRMVRPCLYWPLILVLLLLSLVVFGRVFAICCTSVWWYLLPILNGEESLGATRLPAAKTRASDNKVAALAPASSPPSHGKKGSSGATHHEIVSPRSHAQRKKG